MNNAVKKCPTCAEEIFIEATTCQYCGTRFEVTGIGYCQTCHQMRAAEINGRCKVCRNVVVDLRLESKLIQEPKLVSPPSIEPEAAKMKRPCLTMGILGIVVCCVAGIALWFGRNSIPAVSSLLATNTPTTTMTFTPTNTSTATLTRTPRPTPTATPDRRVLNPANQHLYLYVRIQKTWHEARDYCASLGGHLVTIQAPSENRFVYELVPQLA